jgi:hypothetical protein
VRRVVFLALVLLAAGCGGRGAPGATTLPISGEAMIDGAISAMRSLESAHFEMSRAGAPITIERLVFDRAVGRYAAPSSAEAILQMRAGDLVTELGTISIGDRTWITDPVFGRWHEYEPGTGFNPAVLFDPVEGWAALLADLTAVTVLEQGGPAHHLNATVPAARIGAVTAGLAAPQEVSLDLWLEAATLRIVRLEFSTDGDQGRSDWLITMSDFDAPVEILPPVAG